MKDHVESSHLTKFDAFRVNRDHVMDLETVQNPYKGINLFVSFVTTVKSHNSPTI